MQQQQPLVINGTEVWVEGEGPATVVMIHGWPDTHRLWDGQVAALKSSHRCVRFTLPGFDVTQPRKAYSLAALLATFDAIINQVSPGQPVTLMVHDWGAVFGYQYVMAHPERVARLIGVDIGDANSPEHARSLGLKAKLMVFAYQAWLALAWVLRGKLGDRMSRAMAKAMRCQADPALINCNMNYPYFIQWTGAYGSYRNLLPIKPKCPMLFLYGTKKPFMFHSEEWLTWLRKQPGSAVHAVKAGHWVMVNQPEQFNQLVVAWLLRAGNVGGS